MEAWIGRHVEYYSKVLESSAMAVVHKDRSGISKASLDKGLLAVVITSGRGAALYFTLVFGRTVGHARFLHRHLAIQFRS